VRHK